MNLTLVTALSFALVLSIAALCREVRFRRALQQLVRRLISYWRNHETRPTRDRRSADSSGRRV